MANSAAQDVIHTRGLEKGEGAERVLHARHIRYHLKVLNLVIRTHLGRSSSWRTTCGINGSQTAEPL